MRRSVIKAGLLLALLVGSIVVARWTPVADWIDTDRIAARIETYQDSSWAAPVLVGLLAAFGVLGLPVSPLIFAGAIVFGPLAGWLLNYLGCLAGALAGYGCARWLGGDVISGFIGPERTARMLGLWTKHGFWTIFRVRFLPIPFPLINYGAGLVGVPFLTYSLATALGLIFGVGIYTYIFNALFRAAAGEQTGVVLQGAGVALAILALSFLPTLIQRTRTP